MQVNHTSSSSIGSINPFSTEEAGKKTDAITPLSFFGKKVADVTENKGGSSVTWAIRKTYNSITGAIPKIWRNLTNFASANTAAGRARSDSTDSNVTTESTLSTGSTDSGFGDEQTGSLPSLSNKDYDQALKDQSSLHFKQAKDSSNLLSKLEKNSGKTESVDESDDVFSPAEVAEMAARRQSTKETDALFNYQELDQAHETARTEYIEAKKDANTDPSNKGLKEKAEQKDKTFKAAGEKLESAASTLRSLGMNISKDGSTITKGDTPVYNRTSEKKN